MNVILFFFLENKCSTIQMHMEVRHLSLQVKQYDGNLCVCTYIYNDDIQNLT